MTNKKRERKMTACLSASQEERREIIKIERQRKRDRQRKQS